MNPKLCELTILGAFDCHYSQQSDMSTQPNNRQSIIIITSSKPSVNRGPWYLGADMESDLPQNKKSNGAGSCKMQGGLLIATVVHVSSNPKCKLILLCQ